VDTTYRTANDMTRLVLSRKINQSVIIHESGKVIAEIKLSKVSDKTVKLTFDADESISIDRAEKLNGDLNTDETDLP
jgi:sRNA-binding carbon storage regulator CsrA